MTRLPLLLLSSCLVLGCGGDGADPLAADSETAATASGGTADGAEVSGWFGDTRTLQGAAAVPIDQAPGLAIAAVEDAIAAATGPAGCVVIATDDTTYVEATFTACNGPGGRVGLSGTVRGDLGFDTVPCGPAQCPTAMLWTVTADLSWGDGGALAGDWVVTAPLDPAADRSFDGSFTATGPYGATVTTESSATWSSDADGCVVVDADVQVGGTSALSITGLAHCPGACPTAGTVSFALRRGSLSWSYDGSATVTVSGPSGNSYQLPLHCPT